MLSISTTYYPQAILLVLARVGGVLWVLDRFGGARLPMTFKVVVSLVISIGLLPMIPQGWIEDARLLVTLPTMLLALLQEVAIGACMGFACDLILASTSIAGVLIGMGSSMMMARSIDPMSGQQTGIPQQILTSVLVLFLLLTNTHLELIRLLARSFTTLPMLASWDINNIAGILVGLGSMVFEWGLRLAMPVFCVALLLDSCLGLISKLAPSFDILFLSLPVKLFAGLSVLGLTIRASTSVFEMMREKMLIIFGRLLCG